MIPARYAEMVRPVEPLREPLRRVAVDLRALVAGTAARVPLLGGREGAYVNFDNAASTPPFVAVLRAVNRFAEYYSNVHRGAGFKSRLSTWAYEEARETVRRFIDADPVHDVVLFTRNTSEAINHLAGRLRFKPDAVVLTTLMEHHSNELPWRRVAEVVHVGLTPDGAVDEDDLAARLRQYRSRVAVLAVTGASNVTGLINPVHTWAEWAHAAGALIVVDAAQLAPHRPIAMGPVAERGHLDAVIFSGHKLYAPFGAGVLAGPRHIFEAGSPYQVGGGTVDVVGDERVDWTALPGREEAGTPCIIGAIALAAAIAAFGEIGWARLLAHEAELTALALRSLSAVPGLTIYGSQDHPRVGVVAFNLPGLPHGLVAAILSQEWGIGTRSGCFCAQPYIRRLLGIGEEQVQSSAGTGSPPAGAVRISLGLYNSSDELALLAHALGRITRGCHREGYRYDPSHNEYFHPDLVCDYAGYLQR